MGMEKVNTKSDMFSTTAATLIISNYDAYRFLETFVTVDGTS
jgi:hypothetical protein